MIPAPDTEQRLVRVAESIASSLKRFVDLLERTEKTVMDELANEKARRAAGVDRRTR